MERKKPACVITMVRDDYFFLERWVRYYGDLFGRDALYVFNHGGDPRIAEIAAGCNVMGLPDVFTKSFDATRWRLLQNFGNGLRGYYDFVLICDVDEFVLVDPQSGHDLASFLARRRGPMTLTAIGVEVVHKPELEAEGIEGAMLGARRYLRYTSAYSKPCLFNCPTDLSRGGHYARTSDLRLFRGLYLFHMRYVDEALYRDTIARRSAQVAALGEDSGMISWNWTPERMAADPFYEAAAQPISASFDFSEDLQHMKDSWAPRNEGGLHGFDRRIGAELQTLPERFFGLI